MRAFPTTIGAGGDIGLAQQHIDVPVSVQARPHSFTPSGWFPMLQKIQEVAMQIGAIVVGKPRQIRLTLACLFARGHLLLEDLPGVGKTTLAHTLARSLGLDYKRIQFTNDLLPADITGSSVYQRQEQRFSFMPGPVFTQMLLADEINRASPKTQSALLEVMEESRVTVDGVAHETGRPFMVIATQNPVEQAGTYPLPEAQLDRFLVKTSVGYPQNAAGVEILKGAASPDRSKDLPPVISTSAVDEMSRRAANNFASEAVLGYVQNLVEATRASKDVRVGVSTRGAISMVRAVRVWALSQGRNYVLPDDVKALAHVVWDHRLVLDPDAEFAGATREAVVERALEEVPAPTLRK